MICVVVDEQDDLPTAKKRGRVKSLLTRFFEDPLVGLGLDEDFVASQFESSDDKLAVGWKTRLEELLTKMKSHKSTYQQYVRYWNIFLVRCYCALCLLLIFVLSYGFVRLMERT